MIRSRPATGSGQSSRISVSAFFKRSDDLLFAGRRWLITGAAAIVLVTIIGYWPIAGKYFVADDFVYINLLNLDYRAFLGDHNWVKWLASLFQLSFVDPSTGRYFVRPVVVGTLLGDYLAWGLNPLGYHLNNILEQLAASLAVLLLGWELSHRRGAALLACLLFALLPIHASAVAWVTSRGDVLCGLFMAMSMVLYTQNRTRLIGLLSLMFFLLALASKEMAVMLPPLLAVYELIARRSNLRGALLRQMPFWGLLFGYVLLRLIFFRGLGGPPFVEGLWGWEYPVTGYTLYIVDPLLSDIGVNQALIVDAMLLVLLLLYRNRREVVLGLVWIPMTILPTLLNTVAERYFYIPSIGLALAAAGILANPLPFIPRLSRLATGIAAALLFISYGASLSLRNQDWQRAGEISRRILTQLQVLYPTLPHGSQLFFTGVPERLRQASVFEVNDFSLAPAIQMVYEDPTLNAQNKDTFPFPVVDGGWDSIHFFEYNLKRVKERTDLMQALKLRAQCKGSLTPVMDWDLTVDAQGWEPWNDVGAFGVRNGAMFAEVLGSNPAIGGPKIDISPLTLQSVEVEMQVRAAKPATGTLYWQTLSMADFSPGVKRSFRVSPDVAYHTYLLDLTKGMQYYIGDNVVRLRLDPTDEPAEIQIRSIRVLGRCVNMQQMSCECPR
jgi:hypothetical protein